MRSSRPGYAAEDATTGTVDTRIGKIELDKGLPANPEVEQKIYDEMDFQRATQAYIWALPVVAFEEWQKSNRQVFGASNTDFVLYHGYQDELGILTANATTPYVISLPDLAETGPLVIDYPAGPTAGGIGDFWQRPVTDMGQTGPDKAEGAKFLVVGPGQEPPATDGYIVVRSPTNNIFVGFRALDPDKEKANALIEKVKLYPYAKRDEPPATRVIPANGRPYSQVQPRGMAYWESLNDGIQREPVIERDRFFTAMLVPLGIEKGEPSKPDARQTELLTQGAAIGELMSMNISYAKRFPDSYYRPDTKWAYVIMLDPSQRTPNYDQPDERADYMYEAVTTTKGMVTTTPGVSEKRGGRHHSRGESGSRFL